MKTQHCKSSYGQQQMARAALPRLPLRVVRSSQLHRRKLNVSAISVPSAGVAYNGNSNGNGTGAATKPTTPAIQESTPQPIIQQVNVPEPIPSMLPAPKIFAAAVAGGEAKAKSSSVQILIKGVLAGMYIAMGGAALLAVGGACPGLAGSNPGLQKMLLGAFGLPTFLTMTIISGAELFTGNTALVTMAVLEGRASWGQLAKNWCVSYLGNIIGSAVVVALLMGTGIFSTAAAPLSVAVAKTSLTFSQALLRGIAGNWLVCMAVWQALGAQCFPGKFLSCLLPVSAFVAMGLEHSVANMFVVPMGIALGAPVSMGHFITSNLIPVTIGNAIGGAVFVAVAFCAAFGKLGKGKAA